MMKINNPTIRSLFFACLGLLFGMSVMYLFQYFQPKKTDKSKSNTVQISDNKSAQVQSIDALTEEGLVINYVKKNHELPPYYITKKEARKKGWKPEKGNLCEVLPGRAIGGDHFSNREKTLPKGSQYFEADLNYNCGNRNADRLVYTKEGAVYLTKNHYKTFEKQ